MSFERSFRDKCNNLSKRIPLHFQRRYLANITKESFNASCLTGAYKNKIKALLKNNKSLALGLEYEKAKKVELLSEHKVNADLVMFTKLKLSSMSENLKKVVSSLDEALSLLQMHSTTCVSKFAPKSAIHREEFKEQLKEVFVDTIPEEIEPQTILQSENVQSIKDQFETSSLSTGELFNTSNSDQSRRSLKPRYFKNKQVIKRSLRNKNKNILIESPFKDLYEFSGNKKISTHEKKCKSAIISKRKSSILKENPSYDVNDINENKDLPLKSCNKFSISKKTKSPKVSKTKEKLKCLGSDCNGLEIQKNEITDLKNLHDPSIFPSKELEMPSTKAKKRESLIKVNEKEIKLDILSSTSSKPHEISKSSNLKCSTSDDHSSINEDDTTIKLVSSDSAKDNQNGCEEALSTKKTKLQNETTLEMAKKSKRRKTALKNLSSEINIENLEKDKGLSKKHVINDLATGRKETLPQQKIKLFKEEKLNNLKKKSLKKSEINSENMIKDKDCYIKTYPLNDLIVESVVEKDENICPNIAKGTKSYQYHLISDTKSLITNKNKSAESTHSPLETHPNSTNAFEKLYLKTTLNQGEEMIKNLAKNTFLVTAEVHTLPKQDTSENMRHQDNAYSLQPIVLVNDIFKASKSICKSISCPSNAVQKGYPLEATLLEHCSSLKVIPDESTNFRKNTNDTEFGLRNTLGKDKSTIVHPNIEKDSVEPALLVEGELKDSRKVKQRALRKRHSTDINYKEVPLNLKMRR